MDSCGTLNTPPFTGVMAGREDSDDSSEEMAGEMEQSNALPRSRSGRQIRPKRRLEDEGVKPEPTDSGSDIHYSPDNYGSDTETGPPPRKARYIRART